MHETAQKIIALSARIDGLVSEKLAALRGDNPDYEAIADIERRITSTTAEISVYARDLARDVLAQVVLTPRYSLAGTSAEYVYDSDKALVDKALWLADTNNAYGSGDFELPNTRAGLIYYLMTGETPPKTAEIVSQSRPIARSDALVERLTGWGVTMTAGDIAALVESIMHGGASAVLTDFTARLNIADRPISPAAYTSPNLRIVPKDNSTPDDFTLGRVDDIPF